MCPEAVNSFNQAAAQIEKDRENKRLKEEREYAQLLYFLTIVKPNEIPDNLSALKKAAEAFNDPNNTLSFTQFRDTYLEPAKEEFKKSGLSLLDMIAKHESGGDYNIVYKGGRHDLTHMTINDVRKLQRGLAKRLGSSAAGKYQIMGYTMDGLIKEMGLTGNEIFDEAMQDRMAVQLLNRRGYKEYLKGEITAKQFVKNLSMEWASLPKDESGRSYYAGDKIGNKAFYTFEQTREAVLQAKGVLGGADAKTPFSEAASGPVKNAVVTKPNIDMGLKA